MSVAVVTGEDTVRWDLGDGWAARYEPFLDSFHLDHDGQQHLLLVVWANRTSLQVQFLPSRVSLTDLDLGVFQKFMETVRNFITEEDE